jgi:DNA polymerase-4
MWGVGPVTRAKLADQGILTIGQLANTPGISLERLLGHAVGEKLSSLAWNRDPREIRTHTRARSAGVQSALGRQPAVERVFVPALRHLADRVASRLRAKALAGQTITVRVRFADMRAVRRSVTLDAPISATMILAEIAEGLVCAVLADHRREGVISLLAISVSHLRKQKWSSSNSRSDSPTRGIGRAPAKASRVGRPDRAINDIRERFGRDAIGYAAVALNRKRSVPDAFRELAEKDLGERDG